jgi:acyl dehydratase
MSRKYKIGEALPALVLPPLSRHTLALYCGASGDHNPLHTDLDFAKQAALPDVIGHGMLTMAYLGRLLTGLFPVESIQTFDVRFNSMSRIGDVITCTGLVKETFSQAGRSFLTIALTACVDARELASGNAVVGVEFT